MHSDFIKIGHQPQVDLPIYLSRSGALICGAFNYVGPKRKDLSALYLKIHELVGPQDEPVLDVSAFRYWNAMTIYEEHIAIPWNESLGAEQLERLSIETQVYKMLEPVRELFKRAVGRRWRWQAKSLDSADPNRPKQAWEILKPADR